MKNGTVIIKRTFNAPVEKVWEAITDAKQLSQWFILLPEFIPVAEFEFTLNDKYPSSCKVLEVYKNKKLSYTLSFDQYPAETIVTFELFENEGKTKLVLTHEGLEKIPAAGNKDFTISEFIKGWSENINIALKEFKEKSENKFINKHNLLNNISKN